MEGNKSSLQMYEETLAKYGLEEIVLPVDSSLEQWFAKILFKKGFTVEKSEKYAKKLAKLVSREVNNA